MKFGSGIFRGVQVFDELTKVAEPSVAPIGTFPEYLIDDMTRCHGVIC